MKIPSVKATEDTVSPSYVVYPLQVEKKKKLLQEPPSGIVNVSLPLGGEKADRHEGHLVCGSMGTSATTRFQEIPHKSGPFRTSIIIPVLKLMASPAPLPSRY